MLQRFDVALRKTVIQDVCPNTTVKQANKTNRNDKAWGERAVALPLAGTWNGPPLLSTLVAKLQCKAKRKITVPICWIKIPFFRQRRKSPRTHSKLPNSMV